MVIETIQKIEKLLSIYCKLQGTVQICFFVTFVID